MPSGNQGGNNRLAAPYGSLIDRSKPVVFTFERKRIEGFVGDNIASALLANGQPVPSDVDLLGALDSWADQGQTPGTLTQVTQEKDAPFKVLATRPMCLYPLHPRYDGKGDPTAAASFSCAPQ